MRHVHENSLGHSFVSLALRGHHHAVVQVFTTTARIQAARRLADVHREFYEQQALHSASVADVRSVRDVQLQSGCN